MVDCTGLENRQRATFREFESHRLRQYLHNDLGQSIQRIVVEAGDRIIRCYGIVFLGLRLEIAVVAGWPRAIVGVAGNGGIRGVELGGEAA